MSLVVNNIAIIRKKMGIKQADLAKQLNISPATLCRWENGTRTPSAEDIEALSKALGVPISAIAQLESTIHIKAFKRKVILVFALVTAFLLTLAFSFYELKWNFRLVNETEGEEMGESSWEVSYILPRFYSDEGMEYFAQKQKKCLEKRTDINKSKYYTFIFYENRDSYENDDCLAIYVILADALTD